MDEVLKAASGVNWRKLGKEFIGETVELSYRISRHDPPRCTNLDRIHDEHESDVARLRAVVEEFLTLKAPSWKRVIWALYRIDEIDKAQQIRSYAEPPQGIYAIADIMLWNNVLCGRASLYMELGSNIASSLANHLSCHLVRGVCCN